MRWAVHLTLNEYRRNISHRKSRYEGGGSDSKFFGLRTRVPRKSDSTGIPTAPLLVAREILGLDANWGLDT